MPVPSRLDGAARYSRTFAFFLVLAIAGHANSTVVQVDGTVIPQHDGGSDCEGRLQICLNNSEGVSPPAATAIDAILDAATVPEVFQPNLGNVGFLDVMEGAGFENSFGYYNVGDDVTNAANLHPIFGCGVPASSHTTEAAGYVVNAQHDTANNSTTVNFQTELTAGRYKGGFIGFYLITPEQPTGGQGSPNCGDFIAGSGNQAYTNGRRYYTERDLNNDGDFVHHLVYRSRITTDRFYFGFEDLFRGGDNDFEDMLIRVTGLTPPCSPRAEVCDGIDNDCDGVIDGELATIESGQACSCDNASLTCEAGVAQQGACLPGTTVCVSGAVLCRQDTSPMSETCNGVDDNCNGVIDDGAAGTGGACDGPDADLCNEGTIQCSSGTLVCSDSSGDNVETCNNADDDCDGATDENPSDANLPCDGVDTDLCPEGTTQCNPGGVLVCSDNTGNDRETCNNFDDDCDGMVDNALTDTGVACTVGTGLCARSGATICSSGSLVCNVSPGAGSAEVCNGVDDDCNGVIDDGFNVGNACDPPGACPAGLIECQGGAAGCSTAPGGSNDQSMPETCNGADDDCDGRTDEGLSNLGSCNDGSLCTPGVRACVNGAEVCQGGTPKLPETCNGMDDDCDGMVDNNLTDTGAPCGTDVGICESGTYQCVGGALDCQGATGGDPAETCDGEDDDCDGVLDEDPTDVGSECGLDIMPPTVPKGECKYGRTICLTGGTIGCAGAVPPISELCNGLDDDCDGNIDEDPIDVGTVCGSAMGTCIPGTFVCVDGMRQCMGATPGEPETCNGIDDDCNNIIDDNPTDIGTACGSDVGVCEKGAEACIAGKLQCSGGVLPGTEVCNGLDDDCNGDIDDGDLCEGGVCIKGRCSRPCNLKAEFMPCPLGETCNEDGYCIPDPCFDVACSPNDDGEKTVCEDGDCVPACQVTDCKDPNVCRPRDGACVGNNCNFLPDLCAEDERCVGGLCVSDPCQDVSCDAGEFCRDGDCVGSCASVTCDVGTLCMDGTCVETGCDADCGSGQICQASSGDCVPNPCLSLGSCGEGKTCNPSDGECIDDPCLSISCPGDEVCQLGQCYAADNVPGADRDGGVSGGGGLGDDGDKKKTGQYVSANGGAACSVGRLGGDGFAGLWSLLLALCGLRLRLRFSSRRARRQLLLLALLIALALSGGCRVNPYCVKDCPGEGEGDGDGDKGSGPIDGDGDSRSDGGKGDGGGLGDCKAVLSDDSECNGRDDDCDGFIDEDIDKQSDPQHCGECGKVCTLAGAQTTCDQGACLVLSCFNGFVDLNGDSMGTVKDGIDGCEYECFVTNDGDESCDGIDNDCDGKTDEDTNFDADDNNCGMCGRLCEFFMASGECAKGTCAFDPMMDCEPGFIDDNGVQFDGCEFECTVSNDGDEACDGLDNDCDGKTDEDYNLQANVDRCGRCDRKCEFQNATPSCTAGQCGFDPNTDCDPGFSDLDGVQLNGCEFPCTVTNGGVEICDGLDNDCNGIVDGATTDAGGSCNHGPGGVAQGQCTDTGIVACVNRALVCLNAPKATPEVCDGADNDCDGNTDESPADVGRVCQNPVGVCSAGLSVCNGGVLGCERAVGPTSGGEVCNGLDDDCDGKTDESFPQQGQTCGTNNGPCVTGTWQCGTTAPNLGQLYCDSVQLEGTPELCNNIDDDCDGVIDDAPIDVGGPCGSSVGACVPGTLICAAGGNPMCAGGVPSTTETCNGKDDDCDNSTDENLSRSCYDGATGTQGNAPCQGGTQTCASGNWGPCVGQVVPDVETCDTVDEDCDGTADEALSQTCYTGPGGTLGRGRCRAGARACTGGAYTGSCVGQVTPTTESCNGVDEDCDDKVDETDVGNGNPRTQVCYNGTAGTAGTGPCQQGLQTCAAGTWGACVGEVVDVPHVCGDGIDNDCDGDNDTAEGCTSKGSESRIDGGSAGSNHSFDVRVATAGSPLGRRVYAVWSDLRNGNADVYLSISTNGGASFGTATNLTSGVSDACVKPEIVAARDGSNDRIYIVYQRVNSSDERRLYLRSSSDSGSNFAAAVEIYNGSNTDNFKHSLATSSNGQNVVIAWERLDTASASLNRDIYARSSSDSGASWTTARQINRGSSHVAGKPKTAILENGRRVFVWREVRAGTSFDVWSSWATHSDLNSGQPAASRERQLEPDVSDNRQSDAISLATAGSNVYVVWNDLSTLSSGEADVMFARSTDNGSNYSTGQVLDDPVVELSRSYAPAIAVDPVSSGGSDDRVFVAWPDTREGTQVYFSRSLNAGSTWSAPVRASNDNGGPIPDVASNVGIAFIGGDIVVISYMAETTAEVQHVYGAVTIDAGLAWLYDDFRLDGGSVDAITPVLTPVNSSGSVAGAAVLWVDFRSGSNQNGDIYRAIISP